MKNEHLIIVGGQRSGTTLLTSKLASLPNVAVAGDFPPEPKYFINSDNSFHKDIYTRTLFKDIPPGVRLLVEKSTTYYERLDALERINVTLPDAIIIMMMRDPIERAISNYWFSVEHGHEKRDINSALVSDTFPPTVNSVSTSPFAYKQRSLFGKAIKTLQSVFKHKQLRFIVLEELLADPNNFVQLAKSLGLETPSNVPDLPITNMSQKGAAIISSETYTYLVSYFKEDVQKLFEIMGRQIPLWKTYE